MANRLSKIVTRTGDGGTTGLADGSRVGKETLRIAALGDVDELNSMLGVLLAEDVPIDVHGELVGIQHDLFDCGGEMAIPGYVAVTETQVERLDGWIEVHNAPLSPLKEFILPGGARSAAQAHLARTMCRRAERSVVALARAEVETKPVNPLTLQYLNRLSDYLFILARTLNRRAGCGDVLWQKGKNR
ncbi:MAG: cob(I)yrinic acid a,c-diamide adenosyltransferase [Betaproteobacteria bacterium]|nr:cob(I)yrinic acid a,c-diamide adenosyltransferase [Betaproteobacteria bacterium]